MKKYLNLEIELIILPQSDIVTFSDFDGVDHSFGNPNATPTSDSTWGENS